MKYNFGIDLGGTSAKLALVGPHYKILREGSIPTADFQQPAQLAKKMAEDGFKLM